MKMKRSLGQRLDIVSQLLYSTAMELKALQYYRVELTAEQTEIIESAEDSIDLLGSQIRDIRSDVARKELHKNRWLTRYFI